MITLYCKKNDPEADRIEVKFRELVLAYRSETDSDIHCAYIIEDSKKIEQGEQMEKWFFQLEEELNRQRSLSGDGCYIDPNSGDLC